MNPLKMLASVLGVKTEDVELMFAHITAAADRIHKISTLVEEQHARLSTLERSVAQLQSDLTAFREELS